MPTKSRSILNFAANMALSYFELGGNSQKRNAQTQTPELAEVPAITALKRKDGAVVVILGKRESGKTVLASRLAQVIGRPTYAVSPEQKPISWIKELKLEQISEEPPPYSTLIMDDLPVYMGSRSYQDSFVQQVEKIIPVVRHKRKLILIFVSQTSGQADKWVMDSDLVIMKPMGWLYPEVERPAVKKLADQIAPVFAKMSEAQQKRHCYIFSDQFRGLARIDKPRSGDDY